MRKLSKHVVELFCSDVDTPTRLAIKVSLAVGEVFFWVNPRFIMATRAANSEQVSTHYRRMVNLHWPAQAIWKQLYAPPSTSAASPWRYTALGGAAGR